MSALAPLHGIIKIEREGEKNPRVNIFHKIMVFIFMPINVCVRGVNEFHISIL